MFGQEGYGLRLEWGGEGVSALSGLCAVLVVVDVLSFTTSVDVAVSRGARVKPVRWLDRSTARPNADPAWTLRPSSLTTVRPGELLELASPNGATLCDLASGTGAAVLAGCLRNAEAVAVAALEIADGGPIGVIPAGERWGIDINTAKSDHFFGPLRPCVEDFMGAGAILSALLDHAPVRASVEAQVAADAYRGTAARLDEVIAESVSGRELIGAGHAGDVEVATRVNVSKSAPRLVDGVLQG